MIDKICEFCGKPFQVQNYRKDSARFCSALCRNKVINTGKKSYRWRGGGIEFICKVCGKECLRRRGSTGNTYEFCSATCHNIFRQKRQQLTCTKCGKVFERRLSAAKRHNHDFCSFACYMTYAVGEKSPQWRGGDKKYPASFNRPFKNAIRKRDNYTCAICKEYGDNVHHINYVKNDTVPENCITLCRSCHAKTNSNRDYWIKYFTESYF